MDQELGYRSGNWDIIQHCDGVLGYSLDPRAFIRTCWRMSYLYGGDNGHNVLACCSYWICRHAVSFFIFVKTPLSIWSLSADK